MTTQQKPAFTAYAVTKRGDDQDDWWTPIGAAFPHKDSQGYNIVLQAIPLDGKIVLRTPKEKEETDTERATFPAPYTEADWQPIRFVDAHSPPTLLLHGTDDKEVFPREAVQLRDVMLREHLRVELHLYEHKGHGDTVAPFAPVARWRSPALEDVLTFVHAVAGG